MKKQLRNLLFSIRALFCAELNIGKKAHKLLRTPMFRTEWVLNKSLLLWLLVAVFTSPPASAQISSISTYPATSSASGTPGGVTFEVTTLEHLHLIRMQVALTSTGDSLPLDIYYRPGGVINSGASGPAIDVTNGWIHWGTARITSDTRYIPAPTSDVNLHLSPGKYGFFVISPGQSVNIRSWSTPSDTSHYASGAVTLKTDTGIGFAGPLPNPGEKHKMFIGGFDFYSYEYGTNDIAVFSIDSPAFQCAGANNVAVTLRNYGSTQVQSVQINWKVNNVLQAPFNYTGLLDTIGGTGNFEAQVVIGSFNFAAGQAAEIEVWASMPNGYPDPDSSNDSAATVVTPAMSGAYTIGTSGPTNFHSFNEAVNALKKLGVCGPVVFNIAAGIYNEQVSIDRVIGASATNTVTFQPDAHSVGAVEMKHAASHGDSNYIVKLNGCGHVTIDGISMANNAPDYATSILYEDGAHHNTVQNCSLFGPATPPSTGDAFAIVYCENSPGIEHNIIAGNYIYGGSYGILYRGTSSNDRLNGVTISGNTIEDPYRYGIYVYEVDNVIVSKNQVTSFSSYSGTTYGIYTRYGSKIQVINNEVNSPGFNWPTYALFFSYIDGDNIKKALIANNLLHSGHPMGTTGGIGLHVQNCNYTDIIHNNVISNTPVPSSSTAQFMGPGVNNRALNNIFLNYANGYALRLDNIAGFTSDYNNLLTNGVYLCLHYGGGGNMTNLKQWQNTGNDLHSLSVDPLFPALDSLYTQAAALDNRGFPFPNVNFDMGGNPRSAVAPDIGANEFSSVQGSCNPITEYRIDSIADTRLKVDWIPGRGNTSFYIEYDTAGFTRGSGIFITGAYPNTQPPVYIDNLSGDTKYDIYIGELCNSGADSSYLPAKWTAKTLPSCPPVKKIFLDSISSDSAAFSFQYSFSDIIDIPVFDYEYGPQGFTQGNGTTGSFSNPGRIGGLIHDTGYDIYIRGNCNAKGHGTTDWYGPYSFQTDPLCFPIEDIYLNYISPDSAIFSFSSRSETDSLEYEYGPQGFTQGTGTGGSFSDHGGIGGLMPLTYYDIYVRNNCEEEGKGTSVWFGPFTFYTACPLAMSGAYTVNPSQALGNRNFRTFRQLISDLKNCGINGPVTVNISQGIYPEQVQISRIPGLSAVNSLNIQADPSNTSPVEIKYAATGSHDNYVWQIDSASYVTLSGLTLTSESFSGYGTVMKITGHCSHLVIEGNTFNGLHNFDRNEDTRVLLKSGVATNIQIGNNEIFGGSYGIYWPGNSTSVETDNSIDSNYIENFSTAGIHASFQNRLSLWGNRISGIRSSTGANYYGISVENTKGYIKVVGNHITIESNARNHALYFDQIRGNTSLTPSIIANNMIVVSGTLGESNGIYATTCEYTDVVHNSILIHGFPNISRGIGIRSATGIQVLNNNIVNTSGGIAVEVDTPAIFSRMDYNNYYITGPSLGSWGSNTASDMNTWRIVSGKESSSVSGNPDYQSTTDLHVRSPLLKNAGTPYPGVPVDYDGEARSAIAPDIGADEFPQNACFTSYNLKASNIYDSRVDLTWIEGAGNSHNIEYGLEGYLQGTGTKITGISGSIYSLSGLAPQTSYDIYISDYCSSGDTSYWFGPLTVQTRCISQLLGTYTIDNRQPTGSTNYSSFSEAAAELRNCGIRGPVVFNVQEGVYNDSLFIENIEGSGAVNTITFQPNPANSQPVLLQRASKNALNNYVVRFKHTSYIAIKGMSITARDTNYGRVIDFQGRNEHIIIENNTLNGVTVPFSNSISNSIAVIANEDQSLGNNIHHCTIRNNTIYHGSTGVYLSGSNSTRGKGNFIEGNFIEDFLSEGIKIQYQDSLLIEKNIITSTSYSPTYGISALYIDHGRLNNNIVAIKGPANKFGIYLFNWKGTSGKPCSVANNMVSARSNSGNAYGLDINGQVYMDIIYNSVWVNAGTHGKGLYVINGRHNTRLLNNSIANAGPGPAMEVSSGSSAGISEMNYNNFYSSDPVLGTWAGIHATDLGEWRTISSKDANSVSGDPFYNASDNLHFSGISSILNGAGTPYPGITTDIDGHIRSATTPDIGADEGPDCNISQGLMIDSISCKNIMLNWTPGTAGAFALLEYDTAGFTPGSGNILFTGSPTGIYGLKSNTSYEVYISDTCGRDTLITLGPVSFTTLPDTTTASYSFTINPATLSSQSIDFDASASAAANTYQWNFGDGNSGSGMMTSHSYITNGTYNVQLIVTGDCGQDTLVQTVEISNISLEENIISRSLEVYPNPTEDRIQIHFETQSSKEVVIHLCDLSGKLVLERKLTDVNGRYEGEISLEHLAKGTYMLQIRSSGMEVSRRVVKQ